jgi:hypothetical protein
MWENRYEDLLLEWSALRASAKVLPLEDALHLIHNWWQNAPLGSQHLHIADYEDWPTPWELLLEKSFDELAKSIGIAYTLILLEHDEIKSLQVAQAENYSVVQINDGQYTLNDQPGEITADQSTISIRYSVDSRYLAARL